MSKKALCAVLVPVMVLGISAPVLARDGGGQAFITSATPLSPAEMDQYSQQQTDADQTKLLCQGGDNDTVRKIVVIGIMVAIIVVATTVAYS